MDPKTLQLLSERRLDNAMLLNRTQAWEFALFALTIWREARGEPHRGKLGVAWSIRNRVMKPGKDWWGNDWEEVILKKWQYSSISDPSDPNVKILPGDPKTDATWAECLAVAEDVYGNIVADPTGGATHYHAAWMTGDKLPKWAETAQFKVQLGNHLFYVAA